MKITKVEPLLLDRFLYVRISTDAGITGIGESGTWGQLEASAASITKYGEYLMGRDPFPIEHHWNVMLRANHFTGGAITGAVSAIDIALWDIKGKAFGVPVYELLGGRMRHKARLYGHVKGRTIDKLVDEAVRLKEAGFTALGHLNPLLDESEDEPFYKPHAARIEEAIDNVRRLREAVGPKVDLCIEIHRRLTPPEAIALGRGIEKYTPMFFEDPLRPNSFDAMAEVARHIDIPIATGERFTSLYQFQTLLTRNAVQYLRPDVCLVRRHHRDEEGRRDRRGARRVGGAAQSAVADQHRGVSADRRLHPELRDPGVSVAHAGPGWREGAAGQRPGDAGWRSRSTGSSPFPTGRGSASNWWRMWSGGSRIGRGRSRCGRTSMGRWWICRRRVTPRQDWSDHQTACLNGKSIKAWRGR